MTNLLYTVHALTCIAIIVLVLMQRGKGASLGIAFGSGSSQGLFASGDGSQTMVKVTTILATIFFITSLSIGYLNRNSTSVNLTSNQLPSQELA